MYEACTTKDKISKELCNSNIFITANNRELESRFHSLQSNSHELRVIHLKQVLHRGVSVVI